VGLARTHLSGLSCEYEGDVAPVPAPCRFTGSEVRPRLHLEEHVLVFILGC